MLKKYTVYKALHDTTNHFFEALHLCDFWQMEKTEQVLPSKLQRLLSLLQELLASPEVRCVGSVSTVLQCPCPKCRCEERILVYTQWATHVARLLVLVSCWTKECWKTHQINSKTQSWLDSVGDWTLRLLRNFFESFDFISINVTLELVNFIFIGPRWKKLEVYLQEVLQQQGIASLALVGELRETMDVLSRFGCQGEPRVGGLRSQPSWKAQLSC